MEEKMEIKNLIFGELEFLNFGNKKLFEVGVECKILKNVHVPKSQTPIENLKVQSEENITEDNSIQRLSTQGEEQLDSDDDLIPYDMSNDVKDTEKLKPLYLRDLKNNLVNVDSQKEDSTDVFSETLRVSEELILSQLGNDDASFALELLDIFLNLQERSAVDDFEVRIFKACVAILTVHPNESAQYICKEFHTELSKYSVHQRLLMLDILCEAARRLSSIEVKNDKKVSLLSPVKHKKLGSKSTSLFIETDKSKKYETLYDDDFDEPTSDKASASTIDWREVVKQRIASKTRHFAHEAKIPKTTINKFGNVVASFFYPLAYGFSNCKQSFMYELPRNYQDHESMLLTRYLETLATIMSSAQNCPLAPKMAKEIAELSWTLRYHERGKVRLAVIKCVTAVLISVPEFELKGDLLSALMEIMMWLIDVTQNTYKGDPDNDCKELGRHVLYLVDSIVQGLVQTS